MAKKVVLLTGGAGFIGSNLAEELLRRSYRVIALDSLSVGSRDNIKELLKNPSFEFVRGDIRNKALLIRLVKRADLVFHLAAILGVKVIVEKPLEMIEVNVEGTKNVAEACFLAGKKKLLFTSSSEVYGKNEKVPLSEETSSSVFGSTKVTRWGYGISKSLAEQILWAYSENGLPISIVRLFNTYGPRGFNSSYAHVIPNFISLAFKGQPLTVHGTGKQKRCFCFVDNTVNGIILAANKLQNDVINLGSNRESTILSLANKIIKISDSKSKIVFVPESKVYKRRYEGVKRRIPDIRKATRLGFKPETTLEEGLRKTIAWAKQFKQV